MPDRLFLLDLEAVDPADRIEILRAVCETLKDQIGTHDGLVISTSTDKPSLTLDAVQQEINDELEEQRAERAQEKLRKDRPPNPEIVPDVSTPEKRETAVEKSKASLGKAVGEVAQKSAIGIAVRWVAHVLGIG
ncbi:MAG: hypothetical protein AAF532_09405 [Planctomycetota bacterium]